MNTEIVASKTLSEADAVLPRFNWQDDDKREYLSYRLCGYSRLESCKFSGVASSKVSGWLKRDPEFRDIEKRDLIYLRRNFAKEIVALDFSRNYKLIMDHDHAVMKRIRERPDYITDSDREYLHKIRPLYTPQQMQALESMFKSESNGPENWDQVLVFVARRHGEAKEAFEYSDQEERGIEEYQEGTVIEGRKAGG